VPTNARLSRFYNKFCLQRDRSTIYTETEREAAWAEIEDALRQYDNVDEIVAPQTYLIGVGTK
jgi:hypothetical protein